MLKVIRLDGIESALILLIIKPQDKNVHLRIKILIFLEQHKHLIQA